MVFVVIKNEEIGGKDGGENFVIKNDDKFYVKSTAEKSNNREEVLKFIFLTINSLKFKIYIHTFT